MVKCSQRVRVSLSAVSSIADFFFCKKKKNYYFLCGYVKLNCIKVEEKTSWELQLQSFCASVITKNANKIAEGLYINTDNRVSNLFILNIFLVACVLQDFC